MKYITPPFNWSGGKRKLIPHILPLMPYRVNNFYSPFLGGGATEIAVLQSTIIEGDVFFSDVNPRLIRQWLFIRDAVSDVIDDLYYHDLEGDFEQVKADYNDGIQLPGSFIYLLQKCFSSKYRENEDGTFNGTWASDGGKPLPSPEKLHKLADLIRLVNFVAKGWTWLLSQNIGEGDLVFVDPPYIGTAVNYAKDGWKSVELHHLLHTLAYWASRGATCILTETEAVLATLDECGIDYDYEAVEKKHKIVGNSDAGDTIEVVVQIFG
jgi:DNA adenine methylase